MCFNSYGRAAVGSSRRGREGRKSKVRPWRSSLLCPLVGYFLLSNRKEEDGVGVR